MILLQSFGAYWYMLSVQLNLLEEGGKLEIHDERNVTAELAIDYRIRPRLFHCSDSSGSFRVYEVFRFHQSDLVSADVMILDVRTEIFLWIGKQSRIDEQRMARRLAQEYVETAPDGRPSECPIIEVLEGREPWIFTRHFHGWKESKEIEKETFVDPYQKNLDALYKLGIMGRVIEKPPEEKPIQESKWSSFRKPTTIRKGSELETKKHSSSIRTSENRRSVVSLVL